MAIMTGGIFEVVERVFVSDLLDRAAHAVARDNALYDVAAATEEELLARASRAIRAELGDRLDPDLLSIEINAYDDPSTMLRGELSGGANGLLGGDAGDMVVVRLRFAPQTPFGHFQQALMSDDFSFRAMAVARNERATGLPGSE